MYFASLIGLSLLLARPVYLVYSGSQERSAQAIAFGLAETIDSLSPGMSVLVMLSSYPAVGLSAALAGNTVTASFGETTATANVVYALPHTPIAAGTVYNFTLVSGLIEVAQVRHD